MNKILMFSLIGLLAITLVSAVDYIFEITPVTIPAQVEKQAQAVEVITFDCDGQTFQVNGSEPDGQWDENDIRTAVRHENCTGEKTNIYKDGKQLKKNKYGDIGFDENELQEKECIKDGKEYDEDKAPKCKDKVVEEPVEEPIEEIVK